MDDDYEATDYPIPPDFEDHVQTDEFDQQCLADFKKTRPITPDPDDSDTASSRPLWSPVAPTSSSFSSVGLSPHDPPPLEAKYYYYFGYRSDGRVSCPELVFRTSKDIWVPPTGPCTYPREMKLCDIPADHELAKNLTLWDPLRDQVHGRLDMQ
ncbi:hypothetical protein F5I97DRAFT_1161115 [Phlebopus sp. FC_14]|nr:hypothetical protein F5I97DRAFT_1161115 [Phlebopus sp. FC_14]